MQIQEQVKTCIARLLDREAAALSLIVGNGVSAFESNDFDKVEGLLREAVSKKHRIQQIEILLNDWSDLNKIDPLLDAAIEHDLAFDALSINSADGDYGQMSTILKSLMTVILQIGSEAFIEMKLDIVQSSYKRALELKSFQRRFEELSKADQSESIQIEPAKRLSAVA